MAAGLGLLLSPVWPSGLIYRWEGPTTNTPCIFHWIPTAFSRGNIRHHAGPSMVLTRSPWRNDRLHRQALEHFKYCHFNLQYLCICHQSLNPPFSSFLLSVDNAQDLTFALIWLEAYQFYHFLQRLSFTFCWFLCWLPISPHWFLFFFSSIFSSVYFGNNLLFLF